MVLIAIHSGGFLRRPPALLLLTLVALAALGVWARVHGSRRMAATFASKAPGFTVPDTATRDRLRVLIAEKRELLAQLDPKANEGTFSVNLPHFIRSPGLALAYRKLSARRIAVAGDPRCSFRQAGVVAAAAHGAGLAVCAGCGDPCDHRDFLRRLRRRRRSDYLVAFAGMGRLIWMV